MSVSVETLQDVDQRTQLVMDRIAYEQDPDALFEVARPVQVGAEREGGSRSGYCSVCRDLAWHESIILLTEVFG